jgi:hypothetical protein
LRECSSAEFAEKFLFVHTVLESFAAVDEDYGNFVGVEASNVGIGVYIDLTPAVPTALLEFDEALLDDFAEMTSLAGINDDFPKLRHAKECSSVGARFQGRKCQSLRQKSGAARRLRNHKDSVESADDEGRNDDERAGAFWKDDAGDRRG